jgi:hypothetical protein
MALTLMQKVDLASDTAEIHFSNITGFANLMVIANLRSNYANASDDGIAIRLNDIATGFTSIDVKSEVSVMVSDTFYDDTQIVTNENVGGRTSTAVNTSGIKGTSKILFPSYSESGWLKCIMAEYKFYESSNRNFVLGKVGTTWNSTVPINTITLYPADGSAWEAGSVATLYGLQAA